MVSAGNTAQFKLSALLKGKGYLLTAPLVALALFLALQQISFFQMIENKTVDLRFQLRAGSDPKADPRLVFIDIDEATLSGRDWPLPRSLHGDLLKLLSQVDPAIVGWDVLFTEPSGNPADDQSLADGAQAVAPMIIGADLDDDKRSIARNTASSPGATDPLPRVKGDIQKIAYHAAAAKFPIPILANAAMSGFVNSNPESSLDDIRRKMPMVVRVGDKIYPSLSTQILIQYWQLKPENVWVTLGKSIDFHTLDGVVSVPINEGGEFLINYRSVPSFYSLSYTSALSHLAELLQEHKPWPFPVSLKDKIILVGASAQGANDRGPSPLNSLIPLPLTHLNVLSNILQHDFLTVAPWYWVALGWLVIAYASLVLAVRQSSISMAVAIPLGIVVVYAIVAYLFFRWKSFLLPVFWPVGAFFAVHGGSILLRWLDDQKSKAEIKSVFGSFVSSSVMNQLLKSPENVKLGGESKPVTIFFSDIRSFSTFSENMGVQELISQLNEYFVRMVNRVIINDGTLHKFIGDAVMAVWGDVLPSDIVLDAKKAVRSALQQRRELVELNKLRRERGLFDFHIGMGLNHGTVVVGNIGAEGQKLEFTVIGDAVNLASRLEGVTKQFHTDLVIGESVRELIGDEFLLRTIGLLVVKGKTKPIRAYEVFEEFADPDNIWDRDWVYTYEKGFNLYLERKFTEAIACFEKCLELHPDDFCTNEYCQECREFAQTPPPDNWTGVLKLDSK